MVSFSLPLLIFLYTFYLETTETENSPGTTPAAPAAPVQGQDSANPGGCHSNNSSSSSSEGAPEEFQVAMDTNENNLWTENVMEEKLGLLDPNSFQTNGFSIDLSYIQLSQDGPLYILWGHRF